MTTKYLIDGKVYQLFIATTKARIESVKKSEKGYVLDGDRVYVCYNVKYPSFPKVVEGICENCSFEYDNPQSTHLFKVKDKLVCGECANSWEHEKAEALDRYGEN